MNTTINCARITILLLAVTAAACAGDEETHHSSEYLQGEFENGDDNGVIRFLYGEDGRFLWEGATPDSDAAGTFSADDTVVTMELEGMGAVVSWTYYADADHYAPIAFLPSGSSDDAIGSWTRSQTIENGPTTTVYEDVIELRDDGTASAEMFVEAGEGSASFEGTWREVEPAVLAVNLDGDAGPFSMTLLAAEGRALMPWAFSRE